MMIPCGRHYQAGSHLPSNTLPGCLRTTRTPRRRSLPGDAPPPPAAVPGAAVLFSVSLAPPSVEAALLALAPQVRVAKRDAGVAEAEQSQSLTQSHRCAPRTSC
jgi:hypothetical protein